MLWILFDKDTHTFFPDKDNQFFLSSFPADVQSGLLEVVSPSPHYYPNFSNVKENFGDSKDRVKYVCHCFLLLWNSTSQSTWMTLWLRHRENNPVTTSEVEMKRDHCKVTRQVIAFDFTFDPSIYPVSPTITSPFIYSLSSLSQTPTITDWWRFTKVLYFIQILTLSLSFLRWRTKQNLDFSYLMHYAHDKGTYYIQVSS